MIGRFFQENMRLRRKKQDKTFFFSDRTLTRYQKALELAHLLTRRFAVLTRVYSLELFFDNLAVDFFECQHETVLHQVSGGALLPESLVRNIY